MLSKPPVPEKPTVPLRATQLSSSQNIRDFAVRRRDTSDSQETDSSLKTGGININTFAGGFGSRTGQRLIFWKLFFGIL